MISLKDYYEINEGATRTKINNQWVVPGQTIICSNPYYSDKPDWELKFIEKEGKDKLKAINLHGVTVTIDIDKVKEVIPMEKEPKEKQGLSPKQIQSIKYKIADLETNLMEIIRDMENDPEAIAEAERGGGPVTDRYGKEMSKVQRQIDALYAKIDKK